MALIAVALVIYAGVQMIVGVGDEEKYKKAKDFIGRILLGLGIILLSYVAVAFVLQILNS